MSILHCEDVIIDNKVFNVTVFGALPATRILIKVGKVLAAFIRSDVKIDFEDKQWYKKVFSSIDLKTLVQDVLNSLTEDEFEELVFKICLNTTFNGQPLNNIEYFNRTFAGAENLLTLYKLIFKILAINFFLKNITDLIEKISIQTNPIEEVQK